MSDQIVKLPAQIVGMNPRSDRSWRISFETRELTGDEAAILAENFQGEGWLLFSPNISSSVEAKDIPKIDADAGVESPSVKLRKRLYVLWAQQGKKGSFENFYLNKMQKFMEFIEEKLEPKEG